MVAEEFSSVINDPNQPWKMVDDDLNFTLFFVHDNFWVEFCKVGSYHSISGFWYKYLVLIINGLIIALQFSRGKKNQCCARQQHIIDKIMKKAKGI